MAHGSDYRDRVIAYYDKTESRFGYSLLFGGRKHFGYYPEGTKHVSMSTAMRLMEDRVGKALALPAGSLVLDAGCGEGHTAQHLHERFGLRVDGVDLVDFNIARGIRRVTKQGLTSNVHLQVGGYTALPFPDDTFDGVYTLETLVHAPDYTQALEEFRRVLKPGGRLVLFEYSMPAQSDLGAKEREIFAAINEGSAMFSFPKFENDRFPEILTDAGYRVESVTDIRYRVAPMLKRMAQICWLPYQIAKLIGRQTRYINTMAAVEYYRLGELMHYNIVAAIKP